MYLQHFPLSSKLCIQDSMNYWGLSSTTGNCVLGQSFQVTLDIYPLLFMAMTTSSRDAFPARSPIPVDCALYLARARHRARQAVGRRQAQVVLAVRGEDNVLCARCVGPQVRYEPAKLMWQVPACTCLSPETVNDAADTPAGLGHGSLFHAGKCTSTLLLSGQCCDVLGIAWQTNSVSSL